MKKTVIIILLPLLLIGCKSFDDAMLTKTPVDPLLATQHASAKPVNDGSGDVLIPNPANPVETIRTNLPPLVFNYSANPKVENITRGAADLIPVPGARLFGEGLIALLGAYAGIRSRKYKRAALAGVEAAQQFREALNQRDKTAEEEVKRQVKRRQKADGSWGIVNDLITKFLK